MENNDIMKFEEVMEYLDIGKNTLYGLLKRGELNVFRIGKVWKIPRKSKAIKEAIESVDAFVLYLPPYILLK